MRLVFLYGPPAAGKLTIASALAERTGIPLFHNHMVVDIARTLFDFGAPPFIELRERLWRESFRVAAVHLDAMIFTFNPEATVDPALLDALFALVTDAGGEVIQVELVCDNETVASRLDSESRRRFSKLTDADVYHEALAAGGFDFEYNFAPALTIDTAADPVAVSVERIETLLQALGSE